MLHKTITILIGFMFVCGSVFAGDTKAKRIRIIDVGSFYTGIEVETALQELANGTMLNALTEDSGFTSGDFIMFYDTTEGLLNKVDYDDLPGGAGGGETLAQTLALGADANDINITSLANIGLDSISPDGDTILLNMSEAAEYMQINQTDTTGVTGTPLIFINDDRTGANADEISEATIHIDAQGTYGFYLQDGQAWFSQTVWLADDINLRFGQTVATQWNINYDNSGDDQLLLYTRKTAAIATTDPMYQILVDSNTANGTGMTADQQVWGIAKGTQASNVDLIWIDEDGDGYLAGNFDIRGTIRSCHRRRRSRRHNQRRRAY